VWDRHPELQRQHFNQPATKVMDLQRLLPLAGGSPAHARSVALWWAVIANVTEFVGRELGVANLGLQPSASLLHWRTPNPPGQPPAGGQPAHADNSVPAWSSSSSVHLCFKIRTQCARVPSRGWCTHG
jgi:hypothetical protein